MNINAIVASVFAVVVLIAVGVVGFALATMDDALHLVCLPVVGLIVLALAARALRDSVNLLQNLVDWWTNRQMALDVHRVTMDKASLDLLLVQPDMAGLLPVARKQLSSGALTPQVLLLLAQHVANGQPVQPVPHSVNYSPHFARIEEAKGDIVNPALVESSKMFGDVPTFTDLFESGIISSDNFVFGFTQDRQPFYGELADVYSSLIVAKSGGGKTTLQRFLLAQAVLKGAKIWVADPHGLTAQGMVNALKPLERYYACKPAIEDEEIRDIVKHFVAMGEARIKGRGDGDVIQILAVDELNDIALYNDDGGEIVASLIRAARAYRKVNMYVFASCQSANAEDLGGTTGIRKSFVGRFVLKSDKDQVNKLIPDRKLLDMVPMLEPGRSIFVPTRGAALPLAIPNTTVRDLELCFGSQEVEQVRSQVHLPAFTVVDEPGDEPPAEPISEPVAEPLTIQETRVYEMFMNGAGVDSIIRDVFQVEGKGEAYQTAKLKLYAILRKLMKRP